MGLTAVLESLDGVSDDLKQHYVERDGKFVLDVQPVGGWALEDVAGLRTALAKERQKASEARTAATAFDGLDPDEARKALETLAKLEEEGGDASEKAKAAFERREQALTEKYQRDLDKIRDENKTLRGENDGLLVDHAIAEAVRKHDGNRFLSMALRDKVRVFDHEGKRVAAVVGDDGSARFSERQAQNGEVGLMTPSEIAEQMKSDPEFAPAFKATGAAGGGSTGSAGGSGGAGHIDPSLPPGARRQMARMSGRGG